jgi:hypothetical protein
VAAEEAEWVCSPNPRACRTISLMCLFPFLTPPFCRVKGQLRRGVSSGGHGSRCGVRVDPPSGAAAAAARGARTSSRGTRGAGDAPSEHSVPIREAARLLFASGSEVGLGHRGRQRRKAVRQAPCVPTTACWRRSVPRDRVRETVSFKSPMSRCVLLTRSGRSSSGGLHSLPLGWHDRPTDLLQRVDIALVGRRRECADEGAGSDRLDRPIEPWRAVGLLVGPTRRLGR